MKKHACRIVKMTFFPLWFVCLDVFMQRFGEGLLFVFPHLFNGLRVESNILLNALFSVDILPLPPLLILLLSHSDKVHMKWSYPKVLGETDNINLLKGRAPRDSKGSLFVTKKRDEQKLTRINGRIEL